MTDLSNLGVVAIAVLLGSVSTNNSTEGTMTCTRAIAIDLLNEAHIPAIEPDITILADDLAKVRYELKIDGAYASNRTVRELFLSRLGGIGALSRYLLCIRPKGKR